MISESTSCINCENFQDNATCIKHNKSVKLNNVFDDHVYRQSLKMDMSCLDFLTIILIIALTQALPLRTCSISPEIIIQY